MTPTLGKRQKEIMIFKPKKKMRGQVDTPKEIEPKNKEQEQLESASKGRKAWKPKIEKVNCTIIDEGNFVQLNKYYH